jgi:HSP20 family protein
MAGSSRHGGMANMPSLDVHEEGNELRLTAELPGVKPSDVDVRLDGDMLTISGEKKSETDQTQQGNYHVMERSYGRFSRSVQLPFRPDPDQVRADFDNGVLKIRLQRDARQQTSRRIEVRSGDARGAATETASAERGDMGGGAQGQGREGSGTSGAGATSH